MDLARFYAIQRPGAVDEAELVADVEAQQRALARLRERARSVAGAESGAVDFIEDDITASGQPPGSFDAIVSYEVLEHVQRPEAAFAAMARLLRPGGIAYHDYNPFFVSTAATPHARWRIPWGHVRLDAADFRRYLEELRPTEVEQAMRFYAENLNRMTLLDLRAGAAPARASRSSLGSTASTRRRSPRRCRRGPTDVPGGHARGPPGDIRQRRRPQDGMTQRPAVTLRPATAADEPPPCLANDPVTRAAGFGPTRSPPRTTVVGSPTGSARRPVASWSARRATCPSARSGWTATAMAGSRSASRWHPRRAAEDRPPWPAPRRRVATTPCARPGSSPASGRTMPHRSPCSRGPASMQPVSPTWPAGAASSTRRTPRRDGRGRRSPPRAGRRRDRRPRRGPRWPSHRGSVVVIEQSGDGVADDPRIDGPSVAQPGGTGRRERWTDGKAGRRRPRGGRPVAPAQRPRTSSCRRRSPRAAPQ